MWRASRFRRTAARTRVPSTVRFATCHVPRGAEHQEKAQGFKEALKLGVVPDERMYDHQEVQRKEGTFYCEVCYVELNGLQTMMSHADSTEHKEKMLAREAKRMEMVNLDLD